MPQVSDVRLEEIFNFDDKAKRYKDCVFAIDGELSEAYLERMSKDVEWGDGIVLSAACLLYKRPINIHCVGRPVFTLDCLNIFRRVKQTKWRTDALFFLNIFNNFI